MIGSQPLATKLMDRTGDFFLLFCLYFAKFSLVSFLTSSSAEPSIIYFLFFLFFFECSGAVEPLLELWDVELLVHLSLQSYYAFRVCFKTFPQNLFFFPFFLKTVILPMRYIY